jgi:hypothetical protein
MTRIARNSLFLPTLICIGLGTSQCRPKEFGSAPKQAAPLPQATQAVPGPGTGSDLWTSDVILSKDGSLEKEKGNGTDKVLYPSHAGEGSKTFKVENGFLTWDGNRTRVYFDFYRIKPLVNSEFEFYAEKTDGVDNISTKIGNHSLEDEDYTFGGYGCSFHQKEVESKVEYFHNDQGDGEHADGESMPPDKLIGYKIQKQNVAGSDEITMNCYVDYKGDGNWTLVMKDRRWKKSDWKPGSVPSAKDADEIEDGPYKGILHRWWIRINGDPKGKIKVKNIKIREIGEAQK